MWIALFVALAHVAALAVPEPARAQGTSLRIVNDRNASWPPALVQRVRIVIGSYNQPADLNPPMDLGAPANAPFGSFTIELWVRGVAAENNVGEAGCRTGSDDWITCAIAVDRDILGDPTFGKFGVSICNDGALRAGLTNQSGGIGLCDPAAGLLDGAWHHVALTRNGQTGQVCVFVDGVQGDCAVGPTGAASWNDTAGVSSQSGQDPTLVLGAEKHGFGLPYPGFRGWFDEARFSSVVRYAPCGDGVWCFVRPSAPFTPDTSTLGLYHFDDGLAGAGCSCAGQLNPPVSGTCLADASAGATAAECRFGNAGGRYGPQFSAYTPFGPLDSDADGVPDVSDRCPFAPNLPQFDGGGYQTNTPDGIGDACQCGDLNGDFALFPSHEAPRLRNHLAGLAPGVVDLAKCSVIGGPNDCDLLDAVVLRRAVNGLPPGTGEFCDAAVP